MRFSKQRQAILNMVLNSDNHPTADYIYSKLKIDYPNLSLGTVYRNLSFLSEKGLIKKISIPHLSDMFDHNLNPHAHVVCSNCGEVHDIDTSSIDDIVFNISTDSNISITSYNITFDGVCHKCKREKD